MADARIHVLPGLGASSAMYSGAWRELAGARFHDWPPLDDLRRSPGEPTLEAVAECLIAAADVRAGDVVVGTSLGGMVACAIAERVPLGRLVLVSSAVHPSEISGLLRALHPLATVAPFEWVQRAAGKLPPAAPLRDVVAMFAEADVAFVRAMCAAVFVWRGLAPGLPRPYRIHGRGDLTIPPPADADVLLAGGHLVAMTDPGSCVDALRAVVA